jgi:hypothetical protein
LRAESEQNERNVEQANGKFSETKGKKANWGFGVWKSKSNQKVNMEASKNAFKSEILKNSNGFEAMLG